MKELTTDNTLLCIKDLFKSTYNNLAFTKDRTYTIESIDDGYVWVVDNENNAFSFVLEDEYTMITLSKYFTW